MIQHAQTMRAIVAALNVDRDGAAGYPMYQCDLRHAVNFAHESAFRFESFSAILSRLEAWGHIIGTDGHYLATDDGERHWLVSEDDSDLATKIVAMLDNFRTDSCDEWCSAQWIRDTFSIVGGLDVSVQDITRVLESLFSLGHVYRETGNPTYWSVCDPGVIYWLDGDGDPESHWTNPRPDTQAKEMKRQYFDAIKELFEAIALFGEGEPAVDREDLDCVLTRASATRNQANKAGADVAIIERLHDAYLSHWLDDAAARREQVLQARAIKAACR